MSVSAAANTPSLSALDLLKQNGVTAKAKAKAADTSTTSGSALTGTTAGTTFLNLLVKELQNQDPTAPMDSTAMVGQMISLNQLDQLISINQTLGAATTATTSTGKSTQATMSSADQVAALAALQASGQTTTPSQAATLAASDPNSTLDFSTINNSFGGK